MGIIDIVKAAGDFLDGAAKAAKAAVAPVVNLVESAGRAVGKVCDTIVDIFQGFLGSPIPDGGTNWNAYSHEEMRAMLHTDADPRQVGEQSAVLNSLGKAAFDCADGVGREHGTVEEFWRGKASGAFKDTLDRHSSGGSALGKYTTSLSETMKSASEALALAQRQMPDPVNVSAAMSDGATTGGRLGGIFGGPGAVLGSLLGGGASGFTASLVAANRKAEAVEVMQLFEKTLHEAAPPPPPPPDKLPPGTLTTPAEPVAPPTDPGYGNGSGRSGGYPGSTAAAVPGGVPSAGSPDGTNPNWSAPPGRSEPVPSAIAGPSAGPGPLAGNTSTFASGAVPARATGPDGRPAGGPVGWRDLVGNGSRSGVMSGTGSGIGAGQPQVVAGPIRGGGPAAMSGTRGAPGFPGMAAPGGAGRGSEDKEHRNRMPRKEKPFALDQKPPPPVRGV